MTDMDQSVYLCCEECESYYNEWLGPVYRILIDKEEVGSVRYEEGEDEDYLTPFHIEC